jgi:hypothetical protein
VSISPIELPTPKDIGPIDCGEPVVDLLVEELAHKELATFEDVYNDAIVDELRELLIAELSA